MPEVVTQLCPEQDSNQRPVDRKSNALPVAPPRHGRTYMLPQLCPLASLSVILVTDGLRSSSSASELDIPPTCRVTVGDRAFSVTAAGERNGLSPDVITSSARLQVGEGGRGKNVTRPTKC